MTLLVEKYLDESYAPAAVAERIGVSAETIERLALEMAPVAFKESITIDTPWTDWCGRRHEQFIGRPVAMHAMRGVSAHSDGFQTCRAIHLIQVVLGAVDAPGSHLAKGLPGTRISLRGGKKRPVSGFWPVGAPQFFHALVAAVSAYGGVLAERWLFFTEARHVVNLYHGAQST